MSGATSAAPKDKHKAANSSYTINEVTPSHKKSRINCKLIFFFTSHHFMCINIYMYFTIFLTSPLHVMLPAYDADDDVTPKITKLHQPTEESKCWADSLIGGILMFTDETDPPEDAVVFTQISPFKPTPVSTLHTSYADSHWTDGRLHIHPPPDVLIAIHSYFRNHPPSELSWYDISLIYVSIICSFISISPDDTSIITARGLHMPVPDIALWLVKLLSTSCMDPSFLTTKLVVSYSSV